MNVESETADGETAPEIHIHEGEPVLGTRATRVAEVVHACHSASIDQGLEALAIPGLDRSTLEPVLQYCASLKCISDEVT